MRLNRRLLGVLILEGKELGNLLKPRLADSIVMIERGDAFCFLRPEIPDWIVGNRNLAAILSRCDGRLDALELAAAVGREHPGISEREVLDFLEGIRSDHMLFDDQNTVIPPFEPYPLNSIHLNLTDSCNLRCVYCYARGRDPSTDRITRPEYFSLLDDISGLGRFTITLTGGEPTLNPDWLPIAQKARDLGHSMMLLTNGTCIGTEEAARTAEIFDLVKVSVDGSCEQIHDTLRGKGSYASAMAAVDALSARGAGVLLSMTVTRSNIDDIPGAASKYGSMLTFSPLFRAGSARFRSDLDITGDEYYEALAGAEGVKPLSTLCSVLSSAAGNPVRKCSIGDGEISIGPDGNVYPCHMLHYDQFAAGNIKKAPIRKLLEAPSMLLCRDLTVDRLEDCRECEVRYLCGGACRARSFHATGKIDAADDFCSYEYRAFLEGIFRVYRCS